MPSKINWREIWNIVVQLIGAVAFGVTFGAIIKYFVLGVLELLK